MDVAVNGGIDLFYFKGSTPQENKSNNAQIMKINA